MQLNVLRESTIPVLEISGEVDHFVAPRLKREVDALVESGHYDLVFDFSDVVYLDSGAIGVLFAAIQQLAPRAGRIGLVCQDDNIIRILQLVGVFDRRTNVHLFATRDKALEALQRE